MHAVGLKLHLANDIFVMANAWSARSAILLEEAGIKAIGTTSAALPSIVAHPLMKQHYLSMWHEMKHVELQMRWIFL